jgi:DNA-binding Xre family transcriptional regulator
MIYTRLYLDLLVILTDNQCGTKATQGAEDMPTMASVKVDGAKLRELRTHRFLSREELGEMTGLHRDHIGRLERNEVEDSRLPTIRKLAEALRVDPHELVKPEE